MNKNQFISFIKNPTSFEDKDIKTLTTFVNSFPYCQASHILLSKATHDLNSMLANEKLKHAALYSPDRSILKKIIHLKGEKTPVEAPKKEETKTIKPSKKVTTPTKSTSNDKESTASNNKSSDITSEIEETLKKAQSLKKNIPSLSVEKKETTLKQDVDDSKTQKENVKKEDKKEEKVVKEKKNLNPERILPEIELGYMILSSRLGNVLQERGELTSEYPFIDIYNYEIDAPEKKSTESIVDEFIQKSPTISRVKPKKDDSVQVNLAEKSLKRKSPPKTETLAKLYLSQGNTKKALKIYEDLLLKVPEKKAYFAAQIEKIKKK